MKDFFKAVFASALGTFLAITLGAFAMVVLIVSLASSVGSNHDSAAVSVKPKTMLVIGGELTINDTPAHGAPGLDLLLLGGSGPELDLLRALEAIDLAAKDRNVVGILLNGPLAAGVTQKAEIRKAIAAFKTSGKPVIAWIENGTQGEYYLSSVADKVYVHAAGEVELKGLASYNMYFGDSLKLIGIGVQVTKVGKYKSAVEPYLGGAMSEPAREQSEALMGGIWKRVLGDVAKSRGLSTGALTKTVNSAGIYNAQKAVELKLVDKAMHRDELVKQVRAAGAGADESGTSFLQVNLHRYASKVTLPHSGPKIAIVYVEGEIVDGWGSPGDVGGDRLALVLVARGQHDFRVVFGQHGALVGDDVAHAARADDQDFFAHRVGLFSVHKGGGGKQKGCTVPPPGGDVPATGLLRPPERPSKASFWLAGWTGLEPATSYVTGRRSNQLSYHPGQPKGR